MKEGRKGREGRGFRFAIDRGGTFTDIFAQASVSDLLPHAPRTIH